MIGLGTLLALGLGSTVAGGITSLIGNAVNVNAQKAINKQNIEFQREVNAQQQYNLQHAHQMEVADLKAAGLNPVLSAGGNGAPMVSMNAPQAKAPQIDLSAISSALSGVTSMMSNMMAMNMMDKMNLDRIAGYKAMNSARVNASIDNTIRRLVAAKNLNHAKTQYYYNKAGWKF